jgi:hypothetical protein
MYTSHTMLRIPFMISIAACSLMRYYRVKPSPVVKDLIVDAMDDMLENCRLPNGQFYYKELPSLQFVAIDVAVVLEALAYGYELTGDTKYLEGGLAFYRLITGPLGLRPPRGSLQIIDGAVTVNPNETRYFALCFVSLTTYTRALETAGMMNMIEG